MSSLIVECVQDKCLLRAENGISQREYRHLKSDAVSDFESYICRQLFRGIGEELEKCGRFKPDISHDFVRDARAFRVEAYVMTRKELQEALEKAEKIGRQESYRLQFAEERMNRSKVKAAAVDAFVAGIEIGMKNR